MLQIGIVSSEDSFSIDLTNLSVGYSLVWSCHVETFKQKCLDLCINSALDLLIIELDEPSKDVLDLIHLIPKPPLIIIISHGVSYSDEVYKIHPVDVLFSPVETSAFHDAIERAYAIHSFKKRKAQKRGITVKSNYADVFIEFNQLYYIESKDDYCIFHVLGKPPIKSLLRLKHVLQLLPHTDFIQIHRSFVVSLQKIESIRHKTVYMDVFQLPVSQTFENDLLAAYSRMFY